MAARYLPAREEVGGDWYDVIELPRGKVGVVIGDVVGHGIAAAALMGRLRTALHAYAIESHGPGRTLELVDRFVQSLNEPAMATAAYAVFDTYNSTITYATAGHLPPIVISGASTRMLDVTPAPPLGAFPYGRCPEHELELRSGEMLFLYTDGLVERRGVPLNVGIDALVDAVREARTPEEACRLAVAELVPARRPARRRRRSSPSRTPRFRPSCTCVCRPSRRRWPRCGAMLRRWLLERGADEGDVAEVTIAVSEACANAIEHAYSPAPASFELDAIGENGEVTVTVRDRGPVACAPRARTAAAACRSSSRRWTTCRSTARRPAPRS